MCESLLPSGVQSVDATFKAAEFLAAGVLLDKSAYRVPFLIEKFFLLVCLFAGGGEFLKSRYFDCVGVILRFAQPPSLCIKSYATFESRILC